MQRLFTFALRRTLLVALLLSAIFVCGDLQPLHAESYIVTNTNDDGAGSLRQAIIDANAHGGLDTITFAPNVTGTIMLGAALPPITGELTISGPGAEVLAVSGAGLYRIFTVDAGPVAISGLTLRDGYARNLGWLDSPELNGGAIYSLGALYLRDVVIRDCRADRHGGGIQLYNGDYAAIEIDQSEIYNNTANQGGGISLYSEKTVAITITQSIIHDNSAIELGGAVVLHGGWGNAILTAAASDIYSNTANYGGGFYIDGGLSMVDLQPGVFIRNNTASWGGGGAYVASQNGWGVIDFTANGVTFQENAAGAHGGGLYLDSGATVTATLAATSFLSNTATNYGGALYATSGASPVAPSVTLERAALMHNKADVDGGALFFNGNVLARATDGCIVGNSDTAVVNYYNGIAMDATDNWWGASDGPSGSGPGSGDSVSTNVDFANFKTEPSPICQPIIDVAKMAAGIPKPGDIVTYTLVLTNSGMMADPAVQLTDTLPVQVSFFDWLERPAGANISGGRLGWTGAVEPSSVMTFSLRTTYVGDYSEVVTNTVDFSGTYTTGQRSAAFAAQHLLTVATVGLGSGVVTSAPGGIACGSDCTEAYVPATVVTLTATLQAESVFAGWSGACSGVNPNCVLNMDASKTTTATFTLLHDLTVQKNGDGDGVLSLTPPTPSATCGAGCSEITRPYEHNDAVMVGAVAAADSVFTGWAGACSGLGPCQVTVDSNKIITASFRLLQPLTVHKAGNGDGNVGSTPAGIGCGATCMAFFAPETVVTLTATADISSTFTGWNGACTSLGAACVATMQGATAVTATFALKQWPLTANKTGDGQGNINLDPPNVDCDAACAAITQTYEHGAVVTLTATAAPGFAFGGWLADCAAAGDNPVCSVTMTAVRSATARFLNAYRLAVSKEGNGSGRVNSNDGGIDCGATCSANYASGTVVTLNAQAESGSNFAGWRGDCAAANPNASCQLAIDAAKVATATFNLNRYVLRLAKTGGGLVNLTPPNADCGAACTVLEETYDHGTAVTLTAQADVGFAFTGWGDACAAFGTNPICVVTMDAAKNAAASFAVRKLQLWVIKVGPGRVYGGPPSGAPAIDCGDACQQDYDYGTSVTLRAEPSTGQVFVGWDGACTAAAPSVCAVTMDSAREVTATFGAHGSLAGTVTITGTNPAEVLITAERFTPSGWQWVADTRLNLENASVRSGDDASTGSSVTASASYSVTNLPSGAYRVRFGDLKDNYQTEYYDDVPFNRPDTATTVHVTIDSTVGNIDAILSPAVSALAVITSGAGNSHVDPNTGQVVVIQPRPEPMDVLVHYTPLCPSGSGNPTNVALRYGESTFPMTAYPPGSGSFVGVIPGTSVEDNTIIAVSFNCRGFPTFTVTLGIVQLYDPSGIITDADSSQPVQDAQVVLFRIPGWRPDVAGETRECRTVDTRNGANWDGEPAADVHLGAALNGTTDANLISPDVNPQQTDAAGHYGWDVAEGCYYVLVTAAGYEAKVSPVVGVPPAVTDLDLRLTPLPGQHSIYLPMLSR